jgi:hypothetical protein
MQSKLNNLSLLNHESINGRQVNYEQNCYTPRPFEKKTLGTYEALES